jgi:hypothetical protein
VILVAKLSSNDEQEHVEMELWKLRSPAQQVEEITFW